MNIYVFLIRISVISLLLLSNAVSFGMVIIANLPKSQYKKNSSPEFRAAQSAGFKKFQGKVKADKDKQLLLKNEPENKQFNLAGLLEELQYTVIRFIPSSADLDAFAITSQENFAEVQLHKNKQKPLTKQYLCAMHLNNFVLAKSIKQANPNLQKFYGFPSDIRTCWGYVTKEHEISYGFLTGPGDPIMFKEVGMFLKKQSFPHIGKFGMHFSDNSFAIACLSGNHDNVIKWLETDVTEFDLLYAFRIATNEYNNPLTELLLGRITQITCARRDIQFYCDTLQILKLTDNKYAFKLLINKIPLFCLSPKNCLVDSIKKNASPIEDLMIRQNNIFDENDIALVQLRKKELEKELATRKQDDQHCIIL